jgi:hypothetical protein
MKRPNDQGTAEDGWEFRADRGLRVVAVKHAGPGAGELVNAQLIVDRAAPTLLLRVANYHHHLEGDVTASTPPLDEITAWANLPNNALTLLDLRIVNPIALGPMLLAHRNAVGKKPNLHYAQVLMYKRACEQAGVPYAERIANDNDVEPGVVYRWVQEAGRRKITIDDDEVGQVRIDGEPMNMNGEPQDTGGALAALKLPAGFVPPDRGVL